MKKSHRILDLVQLAEKIKTAAVSEELLYLTRIPRLDAEKEKEIMKSVRESAKELYANLEELYQLLNAIEKDMCDFIKTWNSHVEKEKKQ